MKSIVLFVLIVIIATIAAFFWFNSGEKKYRRIVRSRHEWLRVLDAESWKSECRTREEMNVRKGTIVSCAGMYSDLAALEDERLIESHIVGRAVEYRLTVKGLEFCENNTGEAS